jgi:hypothetical protein
MQSSEMCRRVAPVRTDFSEERVVSLMMEAIRSFETSVRTRVTRHHNPEYDILHLRGRVMY